MKNILKRIESIEECLKNEPPPGELTPALKAVVDRILARSAEAEKSAGKTEEEGEDETSK